MDTAIIGQLPYEGFLVQPLWFDIALGIFIVLALPALIMGYVGIVEGLGKKTGILFPILVILMIPSGIFLSWTYDNSPHSRGDEYAQIALEENSDEVLRMTRDFLDREGFAVNCDDFHNRGSALCEGTEPQVRTTYRDQNIIDVSITGQLDHETDTVQVLAEMTEV